MYMHIGIFSNKSYIWIMMDVCVKRGSTIQIQNESLNRLCIVCCLGSYLAIHGYHDDAIL